MSTYEVVHIEPKYRYKTFMEKTTRISNVEDEMDLASAMNTLYPDHVILEYSEVSA